MLFENVREREREWTFLGVQIDGNGDCGDFIRVPVPVLEELVDIFPQNGKFQPKFNLNQRELERQFCINSIHPVARCTAFASANQNVTGTEMGFPYFFKFTGTGITGTGITGTGKDILGPNAWTGIPFPFPFPFP
jgi:hypothetical protein